MKKQLLDPLGTICKLVSLNFEEINTKISIQNHIMSLQKPESYQFLIRFINGDGRDNISELYYVIIRTIKWYLMIQDYVIDNTTTIIKENNSDDENLEDDYNDVDSIISEKSTEINNNDNKENNYYKITESYEIKKIIKYLIYAFQKLQETYADGNVVLALQFYINILEDGLNGKYDEKKLPKYIIDKEKEYDNLIDYEKLKNLWTIDRLKRICELYDRCFDLINDYDTTKITKSSLIKSYLKSIDSILEHSDKEFLDLITNSNKG